MVVTMIVSVSITMLNSYITHIYIHICKQFNHKNNLLHAISLEKTKTSSSVLHVSLAECINFKKDVLYLQ